ncbi:hypothetical protein D3C71_1751430 [compost metagenome]
MLTNGAAQLKTIHLGQHHIQNGRIKTTRSQPGQPVTGFEGVNQFQLEPLKVNSEWGPKLRVVVNKQNAVHEQFLHRQALMMTSVAVQGMSPTAARTPTAPNAR